MNALTAIAATVYAVTLWMFAPETVWRREVEQAKRNQRNRLTATPTPETVQPETETSAQLSEAPPELDATEEVTPEPESIPEAMTEAIPTPPEPVTEATEPEAIPETVELSIQMLQKPVYTGWTTTQLREEAKRLKLNWRPLINGKRKPLNKPQLIELLTA